MNGGVYIKSLRCWERDFQESSVFVFRLEAVLYYDGMCVKNIF